MKLLDQHSRIWMLFSALWWVAPAAIFAQPFAPVNQPPPPPDGPVEFLTLPTPRASPTVPLIPFRADPQLPATLSAGILVWDAETKEYDAKTGEPTANFTFNLTNVSPTEVVISSVRTSCGCTVAKLPEQPWHLAPGTNGAIQVTANLQGKFGTLVKTVTVDSSAGPKTLMIKVNIPAPPTPPQVAGEMNRTNNIRVAMADRQAVFKGECAKCHVEPTVARMGKELYRAGCAICHEAAHRATMVPDLHAPKQPATREYWAKWVTEGKPGSLMPAFALEHGGPLNKEQIASLVDYLFTDFPRTSATPVATPVPTPAGS